MNVSQNRREFLKQGLAIAVVSSMGTQEMAVAQRLERVKQPLLSGLAFSGDGAYLIVGGDAVRIFRADTGELVDRFVAPRASSSHFGHLAAFPGRENLFAMGGADGIVRIRRVGKELAVGELGEGGKTAWSLAISPDGSLLTCVYSQRVGEVLKQEEIRVWDVASGRVLHRFELSEADLAACVAFSGDGKQIAFARNPAAEDEPSRIEVYGVAEWKRIRTIAMAPGRVLSISFEGAGSGRLVAAGCGPAEAITDTYPGRIWIVQPNAESASEVEQDREYGSIFALQIPNSSRFLARTSVHTAIVDRNGKVKGRRIAPLVQMRDVKTGQIVWSRMTDHSGSMNGFAVSPDGKLVAAILRATICLFDVETGEQVRAIDVSE